VEKNGDAVCLWKGDSQEHISSAMNRLLLYIFCTFRSSNTTNALLPAALRGAQICRYLVYSEADFEVFRPAGATRCTDGGEIWQGGSSVPNFTPIGATTRV